MSNIIITDSDGSTRSTNWPPAEKPIMLDQVAAAKRQADQAVYDAKKASAPYQSHSTLGYTFDGQEMRKNNTTGEVEVVEAK